MTQYPKIKSLMILSLLLNSIALTTLRAQQESTTTTQDGSPIRAKSSTQSPKTPLKDLQIDPRTVSPVPVAAREDGAFHPVCPSPLYSTAETRIMHDGLKIEVCAEAIPIAAKCNPNIIQDPAMNGQNKDGTAWWFIDPCSLGCKKNQGVVVEQDSNNISIHCKSFKDSKIKDIH